MHTCMQYSAAVQPASSPLSVGCVLSSCAVVGGITCRGTRGWGILLQAAPLPSYGWLCVCDSHVICCNQPVQGARTCLVRRR